jgi:hypothetical protein
VAYLICSLPRQALAQPHLTGRIYRPEPTNIERGIDTLIGGALALGARDVWRA